jgi:hypothetical protein
MAERRTFIVLVHAGSDSPTVEDVSTGERVRLGDLAALPQEIERRLGRSTATLPADVVTEQDLA